MLVQGITHPAIKLAAEAPFAPLDARTKTFVESGVEQAGLKLGEAQMELLYRAAPHALAMEQRLCNDLDWAAESASTFRPDIRALTS